MDRQIGIDHPEHEQPGYEERVRERAHAIWESEGRLHGRDVEHWHRAREHVERGSGLGGHPGHVVPSDMPSNAAGLADSDDVGIQVPDAMGVDDLNVTGPLSSPADDHPTTGKSKLAGS